MVTINKSYGRLRDQLGQLAARGRRLAATAQQQMVRCYWQMGRVLNNYVSRAPQKGIYGRQILVQIARDLRISRTSLYDMVTFYKAFPIFRTCGKLSWSHYRLLSMIDSQRHREFYLHAARGGDWSDEQLKVQIKADAFQAARQRRQTPALRPRRGRLYTYRVVHAPPLAAPRLDLGFAIRLEMPTEQLDEAATVVSQKGPAGRVRLQSIPCSPAELYCYRAQIERVVDGDTLWAEIDCGFDVWIRQKLRLRGIDAPELGSVAGRQAKQLVEQLLGESKWVVISTHRSDKYDRYFSDVFFLPGARDPQRIASQGTYLNGTLLQQGMARRMAA